MYMDLSGSWNVTIPGPSSIAGSFKARLPGTLDENRIGEPEKENIATRLTRVSTYEGPAIFTRRLFDSLVLPQDERLFLKVERSRLLALAIDGISAEPAEPATISTPYIFEVTGMIRPGSVIVLTCDNSFPGLPHDDIVYSSAATDETQTNWNGLIGEISLFSKPVNFIRRMSVLPGTADGEYFLNIQVELDLKTELDGVIELHSEAFEYDPAPIEISSRGEVCVLRLDDLPVDHGALLWDEYEGNLQSVTAVLKSSDQVMDEKSCTFGLRVWSSRDGRFTLNSRKIFLRGEANCAEFPETGYPPCDVESWLRILSTYQSYGINCVRFHSHCPPEAAFSAADQLGMLMQPELSCWNPKDAFESEESRLYYRNEAVGIVRHLANHPSFVMLTFGNELHAQQQGHAFMRALIQELKSIDPTRMYANGSNTHYGLIGCDPDSDFYTSSNFYEQDLRGTYAGMKGFLNHEYPGAVHHYRDTMHTLRSTYAKPVYSFEVGQFEILPDFEEIRTYQGVRRPVNLQLIRKKAHERGLDGIFSSYVEATGEIALISYRAEIEAVLRTPEMSGISLLGLQDFTGQGTALVGMLNAHLNPKPYAFARPERFHRFFRDVLLLAGLPRYTMTTDETLSVPISMANYGKETITGPLLISIVRDGRILHTLRTGPVTGPVGELSDLYTYPLSISEPGRYDLSIRLNHEETVYPFWVYDNEPVVWPEMIRLYAEPCDEMRDVLLQGGIVFLAPPAEKDRLPESIRGQFTTDFWSVGTFPEQEGGMGFYIDHKHPALRDFPTENHTDYQWWPMASGLGVKVPDGTKSIVTMMDSYATLRTLSSLFETHVLNGRLMFCSMGLMEKQMYPEARALLVSLIRYMSGPEFQPEQRMDYETIEGMFH